MTALAIGCLALGAAAERLDAQAAPPPGGVTTEQSSYDIYVGDPPQKVGKMRLKTIAVKDVVIFEQEFQAPMGGKDAGFDVQMVYKGDDKPRAQRGKIVTRLGTFKIMDGTLEFGGSSVKVAASGYADKDQKPLTAPVQSTKDVPLPEGVAISFPAFLYYARRLLPQPGEIQKVSLMMAPADLDYPEMLSFQQGCVLSRSAPDADGRTEFVLKRVFAGGNAIPQATLSLDKSGKVIESRFNRFLLKPQAEEPPPKKSPGTKPAAPPP
jgi:hypothetical protein